MTSDNTTNDISTNRWLHILGDDTLPDESAVQTFCSDHESKKEWSEMEELNEAIVRQFGPQHNAQEAWALFTAKHKEEKTKTSEQLHSKNKRVRRMALAVSASGVAAAIFFAVLLIRNSVLTNSNILYEAKANRPEITIMSEGKDKISVKEKHLVVKSASRSELCTITVPEGKTVDITLSDSTHIWINENSSLTYPTRFGTGNREVWLSGEAYFKVEHDAKRPFIVHAGSIETRVLGTEFNIRNYNEHQSHVTLVKGLVEVSTANVKTKIHPGEDAAAVSGDIDVSQVNVMDVTGWRNGVIFFDDAPIKDVLVEICKWYNFNLASNNTKLLDTHVRFEFQRDDSINDVIGVLNQFAEGKIAMKGNTIYLQ